MSKPKYQCRFCLRARSTEDLRIWVESVQSSLELSGCYACHSRHENEVKALQVELSESSLALLNKEAECERLISEVNRLKAENNSQRNVVQFLELPPGSVRTLTMQIIQTMPNQAWSKIFLLPSMMPNHAWSKNFLLPSMMPNHAWSKNLLLPLIAAAEMSLVAAKSRVIRKGLSENPPKPFFQFSGGSPIDQEITKFCRSGELSFSEIVRPEEVYKVAHYLEIGFLMEICGAELCCRLRIGNVPQMLKPARTYGASKLQEEAETLFMRHFDMLKSQVYAVLEGSDVALQGDVTLEADGALEVDVALDAAGDVTGTDRTVSTSQSGPQTGQNLE